MRGDPHVDPAQPAAYPPSWDYTTLFRPDFRFRRQAEWAAVYVRALLQDGEGKLITEAGVFSLLDAGFTWIDPQPEPAAEGGES